MALVGEVPLAIDLAVLRASGALRLIHLLVRNPARANELAAAVAAGQDIDIDAPTNNPDGWNAYGEIFRNFEAVLPPVAPDETSATGSQRSVAGGRPLQIRMPDGYSVDDVVLDMENAKQIPDLSHGDYRLADILVACEWRRTVLEWYINDHFGDKVVVDVSESSAEEWNTLSRFSVGRGLVALNNSSPVWIMQRAGQNADRWPGMGDQPIFTRHVRGQFNWIAPTVLDPAWLIYYHENSGLDIGPALQAAIIAAALKSDSLVPLEIKSHNGNTELHFPELRSFLQIRADDLPNVLRQLNLDSSLKERLRGRWQRRYRK